MMEPFVSVIIPAFQCEEYIAHTLESVLRQHYRHIEILVIDDCSTDRTWEIIHGFPSDRIRCIRTEKNSGGPAHPRNLGIKNAKSPLLAFVDGDDLWLPEKLSIQIDQYRNHCRHGFPPHRFFCHSGYTEFFRDGKEKRVRYPHYSGYMPLLRRCYIGTLTVLAHRELILSHGGFQGQSEYRSVEDYALWLEIAHSLHNENIPIHFIDQPLARYRLRSDSIIARQTMSHASRNLFVISRHIACHSDLHLRPCFSVLFPHLWYYVKSSIRYCFRHLFRHPQR